MKPLNVPAARGLWSIIHAGRVLERILNDEVMPHGEISLREFEVLVAIGANKGESVAGIGRLFGVTRQSMWLIVNRLLWLRCVESSRTTRGLPAGQLHLTSRGASTLFLLEACLNEYEKVFCGKLDANLQIAEWLEPRMEALMPTPEPPPSDQLRGLIAQMWS